MNPVQVSIIVPVYNVSSYIERCLRSVEAQTYKGCMECILVDDCGQDTSMQIANRVIGDYQGSVIFRVISHNANLGLSMARNTGIDAALGQYLYFLDSDDYIYPDCVAQMMAMVDRYPGVEMVQAGATTRESDPKPWLDMTKSLLPEFINGLDNVKPIMLNRRNVPVTAWNRLVLKDFIVRNNLYFCPDLLHEDELWTFLLAKYLTSLAILKQNIYHYEQRETGIMSQHNESRSQSLICIARKMIDEIDHYSTSLTIDYIRKFIHRYSFDIYNESRRLEFLACSSVLSNRVNVFYRQLIKLWLLVAKRNIREHRLLYSLLYHTAPYL